MRNRYPGTCYRCGEHVSAGDGHFERFAGGWRTQHASCAIKWRGTTDPERQAYNERMAPVLEARRQAELVARAAGTGRRAQRARKALRDQTNQAAS